jgi:hypothetical protein
MIGKDGELRYRQRLGAPISIDSRAVERFINNPGRYQRCSFEAIPQLFSS